MYQIMTKVLSRLSDKSYVSITQEDKMKFELNNREVEVEIDQNRDGSRYIGAGYYINTFEDLSDTELDRLQELYNDCEELNAMWG